ncbi:Fe-S cluster assembly protein SufD [Arachidicoccus ginsenosidimutans]|nr:Fe-S cluster assembly protein SufD [Arachidicoccus sp. BS20]
MEKKNLYDTLTESFGQVYAQFEHTESTSLLAKRKAAFDLFAQQNFPTTKNEEWRFTNITPFVNESYALHSCNEVEQSTIQEAIEKATIPNLDAYLLVLVNGVINHEFSNLPSSENIKIQTIDEVKNIAGFDKFVNKTIDVAKFPFAALNTAFFEDGYFIELKKNFQLDKSLQIIHVYSEKENVFLQPRNIVKLAQGTACNIIETSVCISKDTVFVNSFTEVFVEENAYFRHAHFQRGNANERWIVHTQVEQEQNSRYDNYTITLPQADLVRNNLNVVLDGKNTETHLYGLYLVGDKHLVDNHSKIDHKYPNCESNQLYKGVILDGGRGVFNGKIYVHRPAQKTNAFQQNNNLLFSPNAVINSKPQLEIFADDVKCSHGSTVGQFNEESLFYLRSRGVGEESAKSMLVNAFMFDVTEKIKNEALRSYLEHLIEDTIEKAQKEL